jgi:Ca2+-binding EF-hand superfamily protein
MSVLSSTSGYAGYQWPWAQLNQPTGKVNGSTGSGSTLPSASTGFAPGASSLDDGDAAAGVSTSTGTGSPLSLLSNDLQNLLTALQDVSASSASVGQTSSSAGNPASQLFAKLDGDGNGSISQSEWEAGAPQGVTTAQADNAFKSVDTNGDGQISSSELQAARPHGGHHGHHMAAASGDATSNLTQDVESLLQTLQQTGSTASTSTLADGSTAASGGTGSNTVLNDQMTKLLTDLQRYVQTQSTGAVQVSA